MPPRTRATKTTKSLKENIGIPANSKLKSNSKAIKPPRKVLGDKTNSASDDNASLEPVKNVLKKPTTTVKSTESKENNDNIKKTRRDRRLPSRFVDNQVLKNLSNSKENHSPLTVSKPDVKNNANNSQLSKTTPAPNPNKQTSVHDGSANDSTFKSPNKVSDTSLVLVRPRRICRLPSKFEDHSISPNKFIPVQPSHASTPIVQKTVSKLNKEKPVEGSKTKVYKKIEVTHSRSKTELEQAKSTSPNKKITEKSKKASPDTNNNAKGRSLRTRKAALAETKTSPIKKQSNTKSIAPKTASNKGPAKSSNSKISKTPIKTASKQTLKSPMLYVISTKKSPSKYSSTTAPNKKSTKKTITRNFSFKVLEDDKNNESNKDVYEFTYDPSEEPAKKKRKKVVRKKPSKPKTVVFKNNYDQNVNKALNALKNAVSKKNTQETIVEDKQNNIVTQSVTKPQVQRNVASKIIIGGNTNGPTANTGSGIRIQENVLINQNNAPILTSNTQKMEAIARFPEPSRSIRVEDIEADFETSINGDINYSPVNTPERPKTPTNQCNKASEMLHKSNDPLNLRENMSFFDQNPVASSSMNASARHPEASPWRTEFESLPIRWHVSSYVKPSMTPAVECSFVNFNDSSKKKHVYTNMLDTNDAPQEIQKEAPNLVQTSIISFIREVVERNSAKKKRAQSLTPKKANSVTPSKTALFNELSEKGDENLSEAKRQLFTPTKNKNESKDSSKDISNEKQNVREPSKRFKRKNEEELNVAPAKTPRKEKQSKYFGFDDSENLDQENISPKKDVGTKRYLRSRARPVLKELNVLSGPTRAAIPVAVKTVRNTEVERMYEEMKSATDAPVFSEKDQDNVATTNLPETEDMFETSQSVHLFEDVEVHHHLKPQRKSYGKAKKVAFRKVSSDSNTQTTVQRPDSDYEDDLGDLTFDPGMPLEEDKRPKKKPAKKNKMTKKEEEEAEAWAASFNSMCEDVDGFALVVE